MSGLVLFDEYFSAVFELFFIVFEKWFQGVSYIIKYGSLQRLETVVPWGFRKNPRKPPNHRKRFFYALMELILVYLFIFGIVLGHGFFIGLTAQYSNLFCWWYACLFIVHFGIYEWVFLIFTLLVIAAKSHCIQSSVTYGTNTSYLLRV